MKENQNPNIPRPTPPPSGNVSELLFQKANLYPERTAIVIPTESGDMSYTYAEIQNDVRTFMKGLTENGIQKGERILLLFPVCLELYTLIAAIYAVGAVAVLVDPGMGLKRILSAIQTANPKAIVSTQKVFQFRWILPTLWRIPLKFSMDGSGWGIKNISILQTAGMAELQNLVPRSSRDHALITFTSGSTGKPKGADRHHQFLYAQHEALCRSFPLHENQIDMTCFPVVVFHNLSCGITTILPDCDISKPALVDPKKIIAQIEKYRVTSLSAAPIFIQKLLLDLEEKKETLISLRQLAMGGAPIQVNLQELIYRVLPHTTSFAVYGSTEAEPMAHHHIGPPFVDRDAFVGGIPVDFIDLKIVSFPKVPPNNENISQFETEIGEIVVAGKHVNEGYIDNPKANAENKIKDHQGIIWHRTGDRGFQDDKGCIWLVGRSNDVVHHKDKLFDPFPIESRLLRDSNIHQAALIEHQRHGMLFLSTSYRDDEIPNILEQVLQKSELEFTIAATDSIPVDGRHNSKIDRPALRNWLKYAWWNQGRKYRIIEK